MAFATWKIFSMELWVFDKIRSVARPSLYASFWSLVDFQNNGKYSNSLSIKFVKSYIIIISFFKYLLFLKTYLLVCILLHAVVRIHITNSSRLPVRILAMVWCFVTFVLINAYSSTLTAYLLTPRYHPMVDSIKDIASISRPIFMVTKFTSYEDAIFVNRTKSCYPDNCKC